MMPLIKPRRAGPGFGKPDSIERSRLSSLPLEMQAEGVRLLLEMGQTDDQVRERLGLSPGQMKSILADRAPFRRGGDIQTVAEGV